MWYRVFFTVVVWVISLPGARAQPQMAGHSSCPGSATPPDRLQDDRLDLPPLRSRGVSLVGGTVLKMDPVRDRLTVHAFGGRAVILDFDVRTCVMRGDTVVSMRDVQPGSRVYADTIQNDGRVFAKTLRIASDQGLGQARGQLVEYDAGRGLLKLRDAISERLLVLHVVQGVQTKDLVPGAVLKIAFRSAGDGTGMAETIQVLALPGATFSFIGRIVAIDLRNDYLTLAESSDVNTFDVGLDSLPFDERARLREGTEILVHARFDGSNYKAESIEPADAQ